MAAAAAQQNAQAAAAVSASTSAAGFSEQLLNGNANGHRAALPSWPTQASSQSQANAMANAAQFGLPNSALSQLNFFQRSFQRNFNDNMHNSLRTNERPAG